MTKKTGRDPIVIRKATPDDVPGITAVLSEAFYHDPVCRWIFPEDEKRTQRSSAFFGLVARGICLPQGLTFVSEDLNAVALWEPPLGEWPVEPDIPESAWEEITGPDSYVRLGAFGDAMDAHRPDQRHIYLSFIGVLSSARGQGLGSALLDSGLIRRGRQGVPTNLMSSNEVNLGFYESRGYRVIAEADLPDGGPRMWDMWRDVDGG